MRVDARTRAPIDGGFPEAWTWRAVLDDGTEVDEIGLDGHARSFRELEPRRVRGILLGRVARPDGDAGWGILVTVERGSTPRFFRRRKYTVHPETRVAEVETVTCLALEDGDGRGTYLFVGDDGGLLMTDALNPEALEEGGA